MEIINAHVHMVQLKKVLNQKAKTTLCQSSTYKYLDTMLPLTEPKNLLSQMKEAGILKSVLYAVDAPIVYASNEYVFQLCQKYPDKLIGFASANPHKKNAVDILEKAIKKFGFKGCKLHPPLQNFYPNDKKAFSIYEKLVKLNLPVVFHIGSTPFADMARLDQANPILIDEVACSFPKLKIMLTHLGTLWQNEAFMVVEKHPNVYIDTAAYTYEIPQLLTPETVERIGENKIIFGTDYPTPFGKKAHKMKDFVDCIKKLDLSIKIKQKIFSKNFNELLEKKP